MRIAIWISIFAATGFAQNRLEAYLAELDRLDAQAKAAYDREKARAQAAEKAGDCPKADTTRAIEECLSADIAATRANFTTFSGTIRSILALESPGDRTPASGPTGMPLTPVERVKEFDDVAASWDKYSKQQISAAYHLWSGGTIAPVEALTCELMLLRSRMRELNLVYDSQLRHH
jgi:uncharacterized protein YecT (DUF1311 family)